MGNVSVSVKLTQKQAGQLYMKSLQQEKEIAELKAQVKALQDVGQALREPWDLNNILGVKARTLVMAWDKVYGATPAQCLAEIKAQAIAEFSEQIIKHFDGCNYNLTRQTLKCYLHDKIRQQAKEGE